MPVIINQIQLRGYPSGNRSGCHPLKPFNDLIEEALRDLLKKYENKSK
jgi:hypothetical protein